MRWMALARSRSPVYAAMTLDTYESREAYLENLPRWCRLDDIISMRHWVKVGGKNDRHHADV